LGNFFYLHVTREKLPKQRSYEKFVRKMLMKLTTNLHDVIYERPLSDFIHADSVVLKQLEGFYIIKRNFSHIFCISVKPRYTEVELKVVHYTLLIFSPLKIS